MPRKCTICHHKLVEEIDKRIAEGTAFRIIANQFAVGNSSIQRHVEKCLRVDMQQAMVERKIRSKINVTEEYAEQLRLAKATREAAMAWLLDPEDPLKVTLIPRADEIEVVYYDHNDLFMGQPKRKRANLQVMFAALASEGGWQPDKYSVKHVDLRQFALSCLQAADMAIDKLAKIEGAYTENRPNPVAAALSMLQEIAKAEGTDLRGAIRALLAEQKERQIEILPPEVISEVAQQNGIADVIELEATQ